MFWCTYLSCVLRTGDCSCDPSDTRQVQNRQRLEDLRKEIDRLTRAGRKDAENIRKKLRATHKNELEQLIQEHLSETEVLNKEFLRVQGVMTEQNDLLEQRLAELEDL